MTTHNRTVRLRVSEPDAASQMSRLSLRRRGTGRGRRAAAAVEFAIVAPLIFLLLFAAVEFGRVLMTIHAIESAAREGCREAVSWDPSSQHVKQTVADHLTPFGISGYTLKLNPAEPRNARQWAPVTVEIDVPFSRVSWLPVPRFAQRLMLSGSCTLPQESQYDK